jgi:LPS export ABC transporter protein LptC
MKVVTCSGGVTIEYDDDMKLITDSMTYWKESGQIEAPKRVTIQSHSGETSGDSMKGNSITRRFELFGKVTSVFRPKSIE